MKFPPTGAHRGSMRPLLLAIVLNTAPSIAAAASQIVTDLGVSFTLPPGWKYEVREISGRSDVSLIPIEDGRTTVLRCGITRHLLAARFKRMTQEQMNRHYEDQPATSAEFSSKLAEVTGAKVSILDSGKARFHQATAYWAMFAYDSTIKSVGRVDWIGKASFTQTPGYGWNIRCLSASTKGGGAALTGYIAASPDFERFFSSVAFPPSKQRNGSAF